MNLLQYVVRFCLVKFDAKKGTPEAQMPVPEPSDVEKCAHMNFEDQETECKRLENELERIDKAKDKVVAESEENYLEPFQEKMNTTYFSLISILTKSVPDTCFTLKLDN